MLEPLEARVPVRAPTLERLEAQPTSAAAPTPRFAPIAALFASPVFSRLGDIMAANMGAMLDRAEDPARMIRMIILEMEETLVELRAATARTIADRRELEVAIERCDRVAADWAGKAALALEKGREDLARAALEEREKAIAAAVAFAAERDGTSGIMAAQEADIARLGGKLREARARQHAIALRVDSADRRGRVAALLHGERTAGAFAQFDRLETEADLAEARAEALGLGARDEIADLAAEARIDAELQAMKAALAKRLN